jgi:hypothetical protein
MLLTGSYSPPPQAGKLLQVLLVKPCELGRLEPFFRKHSRPAEPFAPLPFWGIVGLTLASLLLFLSGCATPVAPTSAAFSQSPQTTDFALQNCPPIADDAVIVARVSASDSGAPRTQHPGLDLYVQNGATPILLRVHFGDVGDGRNSCLSFDECKNMTELPTAYPVETARTKALVAYLKARDYCVGKFTSWGLPLNPWAASGSNCGDAFLQVVKRLGIASKVLPDMHQWIKKNRGGFWAFERGRRHPVDDFFADRGTAADFGAR